MDDTKQVPVQALPGYAIAQTFRVLRHATDGELRALDLTTPQWVTLSCLAECDGLTGAEMARLHHVTPQTMHTVLHNLEVAGLIVREPDPAHGTLLRVKLTGAGQERLAEATQRVLDVHERMLRGFEPRERDMLRDLLLRCMHALQTDGSDASFPCAD